MAIRTYKVTLDSKNTIAPEPVFLRQGDKTGAVAIDATLSDNGTAISLDGFTPMFKANTADGQAVIADSTGFTVTDSANGKFTYQVPNALSAVPGKITTAYFSFSDSSGSSGSESTFDVAFIIKKAVDITKPQADDYITIIDGTLRSLEEKINDFNTPETFVNLDAIKAKYPSGKNGIMVAADNGHKYIWANGIWTDAGVYQSVGIADGSISLAKFDDSLTTAIRYNYEYGENRLYLDGLEKDKYIERNGVITDYSGWSLSDYLPVEKNEIYVWTFDIPATSNFAPNAYILEAGNVVPNVFCGLFDASKKYIGSGNQETDPLEDKVLVKTDSNTAYVRISQDLKYFASNKAMLVRKALCDQGITEFIPFKRYLKNSPTNTLEEKTNTLEEKTNTLEEKINSFDTNYQPNYDNVVRSIQRIGDGMEHPMHSVEAFKDAYRKGFRILLCDLIFTSDNVPVCYHDSYLNQTYKNVYDSNGVLVSTDNPVYISQNTYATLSGYNYGAMGYPLLKFTDMLKLVKQLGVELYVEVKGMTEQQAKIACSLVRQFVLSDKTSWTGDTSEQMNLVIANLDTARVALMPSTVTDDVIAKLNSLKTGKNKVFIFGWETMALTDEIVNKLMQNDIAFEQGTPSTEQDIKNYFAQGDQYYYCTGIETNSVIAGKVLLESSLSNAE